ncbi:MAG: Zn-dependent oxidoreductase [Methanosphaera stadtmanae]|nr:Zn-dependent oxidoreductase [Methanosphaera stadtmanae]
MVLPVICILQIHNVGKKCEIMKAIVLEKTCEADELEITEIEIPKITPEHVLVKVNAFGINRSEIILREYEADEDYIHLPVVPGIECVGTVIDSMSDEFKVGDKIISLMGGMGRSFNGSYEEYVSLPIKNTFKLNKEICKKLSTEEIAAIPETYFTSYGSLFECLQLSPEDTLLIRGGTSATGLISLSLAKAIGCEVITTSRSNEKIAVLLAHGADYVLIDDGNISKKIKEIYPNGVSKVLELVGPRTMADSLESLSLQGICCVTGILGNIEHIDRFDPIKDIPNGKYLTSFFSNYPTQHIINKIFEYVLEYDLKPPISKVFNSLDDISAAHKLMESNNAQGKIIVKLEDF